jgi:outer membrane protein assembly factor BamB
VFSCDEDGYDLGHSVPVGAGTSPVVVGNLTDPDHRIYVAASDGTISLYRREVQNLAATFNVGQEVTWSLAHADGSLYVGTGTFQTPQGSVIALDDSTGNVLWTRPLPGPVLFPASIAFEHHRPHRVVVGTGGQDQRMYALDPASGVEIWNQPGYAFGQLVHEHVVYYADIGATGLRARSIADGSLIWEYNNPRDFNFNRPAIARNVLYVTSLADQVFAFDATLGDVLWQAQAETGQGVPVPFFDDGQGVALLIFAFGQNSPENSYLLALDANSGALVWTSTIPIAGPGQSGTDPITFWYNFEGERTEVEVGTPDGKLMSFNPYTGQLNWELQLTNSAVIARPHWAYY